MVGIYKITNINNNKTYIGQSVDIDKRINAHFSNKKDIHGELDRDIQKLGKDNFLCEIVTECSPSQLNELEKLYISKFSDNTYNIKSYTTKNNINNLGQKIINVDTGEIFDSVSECSRTYGINQGDISRVCNHSYQHVHGLHFMYYDEYLNNGKYVYQNAENCGKEKKVMCLENNKVYDSCHQAADILNLNFRLISAVCLGKRKSTGNYHFIYV